MDAELPPPQHRKEARPAAGSEVIAVGARQDQSGGKPAVLPAFGGGVLRWQPALYAHGVGA